MIPIKDDAPRLSTPYVTYFLLAANVVAFLFELLVQSGGQRELDRFIFDFGVVPVRLPIALLNGGTVPHELVYQLGTRFVGLQAAFLPLVTSMFLHGGWLHLINNMWALWIFGDNVEDHLGHFKYLLFYLTTGVVAAIVHTAFNLGSVTPTVGASGAIAGIMGAYFVLFPSARVLTWFFFIFFIRLPAWIFLGFWFLTQFLAGASTAIASSQTGGGIAVWAHVGGFAAGILLIKTLPSRPRRYRYYGM